MIFNQIKSRDLLPSGLIMLIATYIVRLYRFKKNCPRSLMGVVEEVGIKGRKAFSHYEELWEILNASKSVKSYRETGAGKKILSRRESQGGK
jgi:hypothetical protein